MNMDVVTTARNVRAATLPQISWEPVWNVPLPIEGPPDPSDTITVTPGLVVYDDDGIPTRIASESPYPVPIAPLPVTRHVIKEFNDPHTPRQVHSVFTLPFGLIAQADFTRLTTNPAAQNARLDLNMPHFDQLRGGLQIKALPPASTKPDKFSASFKGWTVQLDNLRWSILGLRLRMLDARQDRAGRLQPEVPAGWRGSDGPAFSASSFGLRRVDLQQLPRLDRNHRRRRRSPLR